MKKQFLYLVAAFALLTASCSKKSDPDPNEGVTDPNTVAVTADITTNTTWTADKIYTLNKIIYVTNGATLTIQPGTIIKGSKSIAGSGSLVITRGSKLMAEGTVEKPIVFTSAQPAGQRNAQDWGGVILLGKAPVNQGADNQIEGISAGNANALYGGTDAADNSGSLKYVRIEFAGVPLSPDNEINGLTFGGVGSGTTIDYVEVYRSGDDSFEWFGGTVGCKHLMSIAALDDDFDTDFGFSGKVQFGVCQRYPTIADVSGSNAFESDNDANGSVKTPKTSVIFSNMTLLGPQTSATTSNVNANYQHAAQIRRNSSLSCFNSVFAGFVDGIYIDDTKVEVANATSTNFTQGTLVFKNNLIYGSNKNGNEVKGANKSLFEAALRADNVFNPTLYADALLNDPFKFSSGFALPGTPNFLPKTGSVALSGAAFTDAKFNGDSFFDKSATYKGAFGATDWTAGWSSMDPQILPYTTPGAVK